MLNVIYFFLFVHLIGMLIKKMFDKKLIPIKFQSPIIIAIEQKKGVDVKLHIDDKSE